MNVAILHCHFRRGGVTQVVENHVAAFADSAIGQTVLISGGRNDGLSQATIQRTKQLVVDRFDYDELDPHYLPADSANLSDRADQIVQQIVRKLNSIGLSNQDTVLHWHNHSLGKNVAAPLVIDRLASIHGYRQLLQIHDFAEDFRPENYLRLIQAASSQANPPARPVGDCTQADVNRYCYPNSPLIHYATLTGGDATVLSQLGIDVHRIHRLPNCVTLGQEPMPDQSESLDKIRRAAALPPDARWCVYPVRGIRRKNVGELLLLSQFLPEHTYAGITLPPTTAIERESYERWRSIGAEFAGKVIFDAGTFDDVSFRENLAASDFILSTSVAEGFGMAFLEPWLADRAVIARRLPNVVDDFVDSGVVLDRFYDSVSIPADAQWVAECRSESSQAFANAWEKIVDQCGPAFQVTQADHDDQETRIDFATLTPNRQIEVIRRMVSDGGFCKAVKANNRQLIQWLAEPLQRSTLQSNLRTIESKYSLSVSGEQLKTIYGDLIRQPIPGDRTNEPLNQDASVVEMISGQRRFYPCRTETEITR